LTAKLEAEHGTARTGAHQARTEATIRRMGSLSPEVLPMTDRALLFTDVVDSTLRVEQLGDAAAARLWAEHDRRARDLLARHQGREIDRTDGFFLLFDAALDALRYALDYHDAIAALALRARVGLHVGPVTLRENSAEDIARGAKRVEVEGLAKPFAARVMALAAGGQTLLSSRGPSRARQCAP
jgi:class 3 adenylate cyclase